MDHSSHDHNIGPIEQAAIRAALRWFESNSGWAPPDADTLAEWVADGVCRCPDECLVTPDGICPHGLASWALILEAQTVEDEARRHTPSPRPLPGASR